MTTSLIQAAATGLPVIATRHSAFPDQVIEGENGFLVEENNYQDLAEKIIYLIEHSELWSRFGRFGRDHMKKTYDQKVLIEKQIEIYKEIIG